MWAPGRPGNFRRKPRTQEFRGLLFTLIVRFLRDSRGMQNKVDTFCIFRALSNRQISVSGNASESGRISARQRAPFEPGRWTQPRSKKPQRASDRWYSLGVIFSNRGGNSGLRSLSARHPPEPRLRYWNSASVVVPADAGIPLGPISRCAVIPDGLPGIGLFISALWDWVLWLVNPSSWSNCSSLRWRSSLPSERPSSTRCAATTRS